jgi:Domain of unknown function (DUF4157)
VSNDRAKQMQVTIHYREPAHAHGEDLCTFLDASFNPLFIISHARADHAMRVLLPLLSVNIAEIQCCFLQPHLRRNKLRWIISTRDCSSMAPIPASSIRATVIQGSFSVGGPRIPVVAGPVPPVQPRMAGPQPIQTPLPHPNAAQRQIAPGAIAQAAPAHPRATPPPAHHQRMAQPIVPQTRGVHLQAVQPRTATPQGPVVQRVGNGEAFPLPANLSNFGGAGGQRLPDPVRQKMESFFNTSFADVRVHVGPQASSIGALAFTHGSNLYFAAGQDNPNTAQGQHLSGHELTRVLQQREGRVRNPFSSGIAVVQDRGMEDEADRMGQRAACHQVTVQAKPASSARIAPLAARPPSPPMMSPRTTAPGATQGAV